MLKRARPGYYPGFSTLSQKDFWDEATRQLVLARVNDIPPIRFFNPMEARLMKAVLDRILPQDDRNEAHQVPILNFIDERLYFRRLDGYQFEGMPEHPEAHLLGLQAIETMARESHQKSFTDLSIREQEELLQSIQDQKPLSAHEVWKKLPIAHYWTLLVQDAVSAYYAHPYAWDEIGFGGPAYPRGYMRQENGLPEPWEVQEERYEWDAPKESISDQFHPVKDVVSGGHPGKGGTH